MGLFNIFDNFGTKKKTEKFTAMTTGVIVGVSAVQVNKMHLPLAEYEVNGVKYQVRVSYAVARNMGEESSSDPQIIRANMNFGTTFKGQLTRIYGAQVKVMYNPDNPGEAVVVE